MARRLRTWDRDRDILKRLEKGESSRAIGKAKNVDHSTVLKVKKRHEAGRLEDPAEHAARADQQQSWLQEVGRRLETQVLEQRSKD